MAEIPDSISFSDLSKLSSSAPPGITEVDSNEFICEIEVLISQIDRLYKRMQSLQSNTVGQERMQKFEQSALLLFKAQALLIKCTQT